MSLSAFVVPVLLDTDRDADHMLRQWARLYYYGHIYLPTLCVATCGLYGYTALSKRVAKSKQWSRYLQAAASTIAMVPFTWIFMAPTNIHLFKLVALDSFSDLGLVRGLVVKWAVSNISWRRASSILSGPVSKQRTHADPSTAQWLHAARSFSPLVGAFLGFTTLLQELHA